MATTTTLFAIGHMYMCRVCMQKKEMGLFCKQFFVFPFLRIDKFVLKLRSTTDPPQLCGQVCLVKEY